MTFGCRLSAGLSSGRAQRGPVGSGRNDDFGNGRTYFITPPVLIGGHELARIGEPHLGPAAVV
jgi:hypothetical protein